MSEASDAGGTGNVGGAGSTGGAGGSREAGGPRDRPTGGTVYLVGTGPGDPGLMTVRAVELLRRANAVFYDRLIPAEALALTRPDARRIYVGKTPRSEADRDGSTSQEEIIEYLIEAARRHEIVVRLKGGDPFVFGRGGEEAAALRAAGVSFEVVPGVTAGVAGPAYAGIPVTDRGAAGAVAFVTGRPAAEAPDWPALASFPGTLIFYMGVGRLAENCAALIAAGRDPQESAAVIERGTLPAQRVIRGDLTSIAELAQAARVAAPALVVLGAVAARADELSWFEPGPLRGVSVVVTRAGTQAGRTAARLRELGADAIELPTVRLLPRLDEPRVGETIRRLGEFDLATFTSVNGVELFFEALAEAGLDARALAGLKLAAVGPATDEALRRHGLTPEFVPPRAVAESLLESLRETDLRGRRVLIAGAAAMRPVLAEGLRESGAEVHHLALYETVPVQVEPDRLAAALDADYVTIASASAARNLAALLRDAGATLRARLISIGPITTAAAREHGLTVHAEASPHTIDGLIQTLLDQPARHRSP